MLAILVAKLSIFAAPSLHFLFEVGRVDRMDILQQLVMISVVIAGFVSEAHFLLQNVEGVL